jgi:dCTP diphosphatase
MNDFKKLTERLLKFREERDWNRFHNEKDIALSLALEAAEVLEHFQWKNGTREEIKAFAMSKKEEIGDELIDVLWWLLLMAHELDIDIEKAFDRKIKMNEKKYPAKKVKGRADKYTAYSD